MTLKTSAVLFVISLVVAVFGQKSDPPCGGICIESTHCIYYELACLIPPANKIELCLDRWMLCDSQTQDPGGRCPYIHDRSDNITRWFFNRESRQCETFSYRGCDGNGNNFETEDECLQACGKVQCYQPVGIGTPICERGYAPMPGEYWAYHWLLRDCLPFYFFGCGGNYNRYPTKESCMNDCFR